MATSPVFNIILSNHPPLVPVVGNTLLFWNGCHFEKGVEWLPWISK